MSKKKFIIIVLVSILIIKLFQINFLQEIKINIENFEKLDNSYFKETLNTHDNKIEIIRFSKSNQISEIIKFRNIEKNHIFIDCNKMEKLIVYNNENKYELKTNISNLDIRIKNIPKCIEINDEIIKNLKEGNIFAVLYYFKILYIIPAKYNNIDCYKVRTTREILYVDKENLYPVYLEYIQNNSGKEKEKVTVEYVFEENILTDEDIKIPDLTNYTLTQN